MTILSEFFPPKPKWGVQFIPDLTGKVMIVTGGNSGIGKETVKALLAHNAKVYIAARSKARADAAISELKEQTGKQAYFLELDLASLKSIKRAAAEFLQKETQLHVLFNNGGVMLSPIEELTADGYDQQFGVNVLGHFYLTKLLLPTLLSTAEATASDVRVITTSSLGHLFSPPLNFNALRDGPERVKIGTQKLYHMSKLGSTLFANELARRYGDRGLVSISLNPGSLKTNLMRYANLFQRTLSNMLFYPADMGALTQLYAGTAPEASTLNGKYLIPWARVGEARKDAQDPELGKKLWEWLEEQVANV